MPNEVYAPYTEDGTLYFVILNGSTKFYNGTIFVTKNDNNWGSYVLPLSPSDTYGWYIGHFPSNIGGGLYYLLAYEQIGATPSADDPMRHAGMMNWTGNSEGTSDGGSDQTQEFTISFGDADGVSIRGGVSNLDDISSITTGVR